MGNENTKLCENCRDGLIGSALGMTLRDYFAAKAMAALIAEPVSDGWQSTVAHWANKLQGHAQMSGPDIVAHVAYMVADAMLKAREVSND